MPILNQKGLQYCWAYTAAQLIDAWRFSHGDKNTKHLTSPLPLALPMLGKEMNEGGSIEAALAVGVSQGSCNQSKISEFLNTRSGAEFLSDFQGYFELNTRYQRAGALWKKVLGLNFLGQSPVLDQISCEFDHNISKETLLAVRQVTEDVLSTVDQDYAIMLSRILNEACKDSLLKIDKVPDSSTYPDQVDWKAMKEALPQAKIRAKAMTQILNQLLDRSNPQPIALGYCDNVFDPPVPKMPRNGATLMPVAKSSGCRPHASIVIGRRPGPNGQCQFLVRNSWGPDWCPKTSAVECDQKRGQVWVSGDVLGRFINLLQVLEI